ncbi:sensor histidine kinase [Blastopirellula sp. JC732]|uniref:histidine kinase n=1 Tax=Blastopirellula sediminis TaxID=2894196 RepID=A0A9X1MHT7_9BACT|nr:sensor histidine kinase [Blastopirellula sediminis]MCC9607988.1 sensor histidine kinase [Blastopirellula sediminis]MCC9627219.1 sensor histidine kinase [Blastopirellula sediminis]
MKTSRLETARPVRPLLICLTILLVVFVAEIIVMMLLPSVFGESAPWSEAIADAGLLTIILTPVLWFTAIAPLREIATMRARLLEQFVSLQEEERRRIAFDLHDEIGQSLTSVMMGLRAMGDRPDPENYHKRLADLREIVNQAVHEVRRISNGLRPAALDHLGLPLALERLAEDASQVHDLQVERLIDAKDIESLSPPLQIAVYRILQEALTNVVRHAGADKVRILVKRQGDELVLEVEDNGHGMPAETTESPDGHLGLAGMMQRTALLEGDLTLQSQPGKGTLLRARLPILR